MLGSFRKPSQPSKKQQQNQEREWFAVSFKPENFIPGLIIGFIFGLFLDLSKPTTNNTKRNGYILGKQNQQQRVASNNSDEELKMVLVVRQDLKMGTGKIASQCAHAATGMYSELMQGNKLKEAAESIGIPTFVVADAGRTQVLAGSNTVLAIGPEFGPDPFQGPSIHICASAILFGISTGANGPDHPSACQSLMSLCQACSTHLGQ